MSRNSQFTSDYKIVVYVPTSHIDQVKTALFDAGAGQQGHYDQCCWQTLGEGQFRPLPESQPFIGKESQLEGLVEKVQEYRLEILCDQPYLEASIKALRYAHPYEEPAFDVFQRYAI